MVHGLVPGMAGEESSDGSPDDGGGAQMACDDGSDESSDRWWLNVNGQMAQFRWLEMIVQMTVHMA